jgi:ribosomal protein L44E
MSSLIAYDPRVQVQENNLERRLDQLELTTALDGAIPILNHTARPAEQVNFELACRCCRRRQQDDPTHRCRHVLVMRPGDERHNCDAGSDDNVKELDCFVCYPLWQRDPTHRCTHTLN